MGLPEMEELWNKLQSEYRVGTISKNDAIIFKKWGKALKLLSENPRHPSLRTHDIEALSERYGERVWQSYLENKTSEFRFCRLNHSLFGLSWFRAWSNINETIQ